MKSTKEYLAELTKLRRRVRISLPVCILAFTLVAMLGVTVSLFTLASVLVAAVVIGYFVYSRRVKRQYTELLSEAVILHGLCRSLSGAQYLGKNGISREAFERLQMLPLQQEENALICRHAFFGRAGDLAIGGQEIALHYADPHSAKSRSRFLVGALLTAEGKSGEGDWLLLHRGLLTEDALRQFTAERGYHAAVLPEKLGETFCLFTHGTADTAPSELADRLCALDAECRSLGAVRVSAEQCAVYLDNVFFSATRYGKSEPDEDGLRANPLEERDAVLRFFRAGPKGKATRKG